MKQRRGKMDVQPPAYPREPALGKPKLCSEVRHRGRMPALQVLPRATVPLGISFGDSAEPHVWRWDTRGSRGLLVPSRDFAFSGLRETHDLRTDLTASMVSVFMKIIESLHPPDPRGRGEV